VEPKVKAFAALLLEDLQNVFRRGPVQDVFRGFVALCYVRLWHGAGAPLL